LIALVANIIGRAPTATCGHAYPRTGPPPKKKFTMLVTIRSLIPVLPLAGLAVVAATAYAPSAAADSGRGPAVCHPSVESGVEVDTCTGNPNAPDDSGPGEFVRVVPQFCIGLGFFGCDDD
jgi:hypothetical protein